MISQFCFLLFLGILGASFVLLFRRSLGLFNVYALALPMGLTFWGLILLILLATGLPLNIYTTVVLSLLLLTIFVIYQLRNKNFSKKDWKPFLIFLLSLSFISLFFILVNYSTLSNDSWILLTGGKYIATYNDISEHFLTLGGILSYIINSSSVLFGFDYLYALYPLMTFLFLLIFFANLYLPIRRTSFILSREFLFCLLTVLFLLSSYFMLFHAIYLHSNLIYGFYSFLALYGLWKRLICRDKIWLIISCLALVTSSFFRMEAPLFSLILILILISEGTIKLEEKLYYVGINSLFVLLWHTKLFFRLSDYESQYLSSNKALTTVVLYLVLFIVLLISHKGPLKKLREYFPLMMLCALSAGWSYLILTQGLRMKGNLLIMERYGIFILNSIKYGGWGITWIVLGILFAVGLALKKVRHESVFLYYIFSFLLLFNSINLFRGGWRLNWGDSGNRMLIHIIFVISFYAFLKFRNVLFPNAQG